jgi:hypothetical protein
LGIRPVSRANVAIRAFLISDDGRSRAVSNENRLNWSFSWIFRSGGLVASDGDVFRSDLGLAPDEPWAEAAEDLSFLGWGLGRFGMYDAVAASVEGAGGVFRSGDPEAFENFQEVEEGVLGVFCQEIRLCFWAVGLAIELVEVVVEADEVFDDRFLEELEQEGVLVAFELVMEAIEEFLVGGIDRVALIQGCADGAEVVEALGLGGESGFHAAESLAEVHEDLLEVVCWVAGCGGRSAVWLGVALRGAGVALRGVAGGCLFRETSHRLVEGGVVEGCD